jgi:hypothetical protein
MKTVACLFALGMLGAPAISVAQQSDTPPAAPKQTITGEAYFDYYYNIQMRDTSKKDLQGFQIRRIYFTYDHAISADFDARMRLEADGKELSTPSGKLTTFLKEAWMKWKNIFEGSDFIAGLSPTPSYDVSEAAWGYRSLEKVIMDLRGIAPRTDLSVDLKGKITGDGSLNYWMKIGDNSGQTPETDKYKRYYGSLYVKSGTQFQATAYGDYESEPGKFDAFDGQTKSNGRITLAGFLNVREPDQYSFGLEGFYHITQNNLVTGPAGPLENQNAFGITAFAWGSVADRLRLIGRFDAYNSNTAATKNAVYLIIGAIDYMPVKDIHLMPNIWVQSYAADNTTSDVVARMTFNYVYR